jgi:hypothetical protein
MLGITAAVVFAAGVVLSYRRGGVRGIAIFWAAAAAVLTAAGIADWARLPVKETPLVAYLLLATVPGLGAAAITRLLGRSGAAAWLQWSAAAIGFYALEYVALMMSLPWASF